MVDIRRLPGLLCSSQCPMGGVPVFSGRLSSLLLKGELQSPMRGGFGFPVGGGLQSPVGGVPISSGRGKLQSSSGLDVHPFSSWWELQSPVVGGSLLLVAGGGPVSARIGCSSSLQSPSGSDVHPVSSFHLDRTFVQSPVGGRGIPVS